jgi:hypothetical protein
MPELCERCGSAEVIPDARLAPVIGGHAEVLGVQVLGRPDAVFFKAADVRTIAVRLCAACGHVELRVAPAEARALYETYRRSLGA